MKKTINLALQGGGSHGAFTWGVMDRLLEDERIHVEALSGTSAGAMNAVVFADGWMSEGRAGAKAALERFWRAVSKAGRASPLKRNPIDMWMGNWSLDHSPGYLFMDLLSRVMSPYDFNPFNTNPLLDLISETVNFERVRSCDQVKVFISATNVETGRVRVFRREELTPQMVMASACLPYLFRAVEVEGSHYWDGGYMGNPVLFPFFRHCASDDVVVVKINPVVRPGVPKTAREILNRVNEITFNGSLLREFRAIDFVGRLRDHGFLDAERYKHVLVHVIGDEALLPLTASSKLNSEWAFLTHLKEIGRSAAQRWLDAHYEDLGHRSTVDLRGLYHDQGAEV